jgi:hypothetical protein
VHFAVKATAGAQNTQFLPGTESGVSFLRGCCGMRATIRASAGRKKFSAEERERLKRIRF